MRTTFTGEIGKSGVYDTVSTQNPPISEAETQAETDEKVTYPKPIKHRGITYATLYKPSKSYPLYRVAWKAGGKRLMKGFARYGEAKKFGDGIAKQLHEGNPVALLKPWEATAALTAFD